MSAGKPASVGRKASPRGNGRRGLAIPSRPDLHGLGRRATVLVLVLAALAAAYLLVLRDSSLVAVERVTVTGAEREPRVEAALASAATEMTTLHVDEDALRAAVADMPSVLALDTSADFPHGLAIEVDVRRPVAYLDAGGGTILAGDGIVLETNAERPEDLPLIEAEAPPPGVRADGATLALARVLAPAPEALLAETTTARVEDDVGPVVTVGPGIELRFGDPSQAELKWSAAAAVLADPDLESAVYIDLAVPARPVVG
jgi:cell division protein FtsQ